MADSTDLKYMRLAIEQAKQSVRDGQSPFGAVVVKATEDGRGEIVCAVHNVVWATTDITAHAEVHALREACKALGTVDLEGCTVYTSTEPCPMCFAAIHWANCDRIVFGTTIADADRAGFRELSISNEQMKALGGATVEVEGGVLRDEAQAAFDLFAEDSEGKLY